MSQGGKAMVQGHRRFGLEALSLLLGYCHSHQACGKVSVEKDSMLRANLVMTRKKRNHLLNDQQCPLIFLIISLCKILSQFHT